MRLDVYEEVSNVVSGTTNQNTNPLGPTTTIRSASTTVMVQDHRTAVIGGLLSSESDVQRSAIPFISDIPVIGNLFTDNGSNRQKDNLLVFLTPHVVRTREDLRALALDERQKFTDALGRRELHQMPMEQYKQLYQPTFSVPVSPAPGLEDSWLDDGAVRERWRLWRRRLWRWRFRVDAVEHDGAGSFIFGAAQHRRDWANFQGSQARAVDDGAAVITVGDFAVNHLAVDHRLGEPVAPAAALAAVPAAAAGDPP